MAFARRRGSKGVVTEVVVTEVVVSELEVSELDVAELDVTELEVTEGVTKEVVVTEVAATEFGARRSAPRISAACGTRHRTAVRRTTAARPPCLASLVGGREVLAARPCPRARRVPHA
jgi:hypothetical protein